MCGRFTISAQWERIRETFGDLELEEDWQPRFNVAPSQRIPLITNVNPNRVSLFRWGLVPFWATDEKIGYKLINARSETLDEKPSFKAPLKSKRCLVLADGFYEWKKEGRSKIPHLIRLNNNQPFAFAGLWERWDKAGEPLHTCTIITTTANSLVQSIHDRMPVILSPETRADWLNPKIKDTTTLKALLQPYNAAQMTAYPVSSLVNSPKNDVQDCMNAV